jgi:hypothetical protein
MTDTNNEKSNNITIDKTKYRVEKIGTVAIDSGRVVILDPCRVDALSQHLDSPINVTEQLGEFVVGSVTGFGDGRYPVFATLADDHLEVLVLALHVCFDPIYAFADDPKYAQERTAREEGFRRFLEGD